MEHRAAVLPHDLSPEGWTNSSRRSSQQEGCDDCGVFVLMVGIVLAFLGWNNLINSSNGIIEFIAPTDISIYSSN